MDNSNTQKIKTLPLLYWQIYQSKNDQLQQLSFQCPNHTIAMELSLWKSDHFLKSCRVIALNFQRCYFSAPVRSEKCGNWNTLKRRRQPHVAVILRAGTSAGNCLTMMMISAVASARRAWPPFRYNFAEDMDKSVWCEIN